MPQKTPHPLHGRAEDDTAVPGNAVKPILQVESRGHLCGVWFQVVRVQVASAAAAIIQQSWTSPGNSVLHLLLPLLLLLLLHFLLRGL